MKNRWMCALLLGGLVSGSAVSASTLCVESNAAGAQAKQLMYVKSNDLRPNRVLLGLDGSRVAIDVQWAPDPNGQPWFARVDWEKYQMVPSDSPAAAILSFDTDEKGKRYLCRVDTRGYTDSYVRKNAKVAEPTPAEPGDIEVVAQTQLHYDARGRLEAAIERVRAYGERKLSRTSTTCYHYDANDRFLGASFPDEEACTSSKPEQIRDRFVYQADGKLLRRISAEKRMIQRGGKDVLIDDARVTVFGKQGTPTAEYTSDEAGRHYRRSLAPKANDSRYHDIKAVRSAASIDLNQLQNGKAAGLWQIHSMPSAVANDNDGVYDERYLVASGRKPVLNAQERVKIWTALNRPGYDMVLEGQGTFLLVPEVPPALWAACTNPQSATATACP